MNPDYSQLNNFLNPFEQEVFAPRVWLFWVAIFENTAYVSTVILPLTHWNPEPKGTNPQHWLIWVAIFFVNITTHHEIEPLSLLFTSSVFNKNVDYTSVVFQMPDDISESLPNNKNFKIILMTMAMAVPDVNKSPLEIFF